MREITGGVGKDGTVAEPFDMVPSVLAFRVDGLNTNQLTEIRKITGLGEYLSQPKLAFGLLMPAGTHSPIVGQYQNGADPCTRYPISGRSCTIPAPP
jgi:hypothetical protein